jgi:GrpB-like predicted nucleotidyltransferase (UPF0157 family)
MLSRVESQKPLMNTDLGLKRSEVGLAEPNNEWSEEFARESLVISRVLGDLASGIEHVGSTAVNSLPAKPIIDIAVSVETKSAIREIVSKLEGVGYIYRGEAAFQGGHLLVRESSPGVGTHHVHVIEASDPQWRSWLRFRDFLKTDRELRQRYARLKLELKNRFPSDRRSYTLGKTRFIESALKRE